MKSGWRRWPVVAQGGKPFLCLYCDPNRTAMPKVRSMALVAGAALSGRYQQALMRINGMDCSTRATVIEPALGRRDGVPNASVSCAV